MTWPCVIPAGGPVKEVRDGHYRQMWKRVEGQWLISYDTQADGPASAVRPRSRTGFSATLVPNTHGSGLAVMPIDVLQRQAGTACAPRSGTRCMAENC